MIKINKTGEPEELHRNCASWTNEYLAASNADRRSSKYEGRYKKFKNDLFSETHEKCAYCESKFRESYFGDVEHIEPKSKYPEKTYMWTNLTAACAICNNNKRAHDDSNLPLINPVTDEPSDYIQAFGPYLTHKSPGNKGEASITVLELNRAELLERRGEKLNQLTRLIDIANLSVNENTKKLALIELSKQTESDSEYSFVSKSYLSAKDVQV